MPTANDIIKKAISQIGVKENPSGSNKVKYNTEYYGRPVSGSAYPWCCSFVWWIFKQCGASDLFNGGQKTAYCPTVESYYRTKGQWYKSGKVGDLVLFDFYGKGVACHIGIVEKVNSDGTYVCIEGNTSTTNNDNGGAVMRRIRKKNQIRGFARPKYSGNTTTSSYNKGGNTVTVTLSILKYGSKGNEVKTLQRLLMTLGYSCGTTGADGDFGVNTQKSVKAYQQKHKLTADSIVGQKTWESILKNA